MLLRKLIWLFFVALLFTGCIYDSMEECNRTGIIFSYKANGSQELCSSKIKRVNLLVYNMADQLILNRAISEELLQRYRGVDLKLAPGRYTLVAIGNVLENTVIEFPEDLERARLTTPAFLAGQRIETNDSLYFARKTILVPEGGWLNDTLKFASAHIALKVLVKGLETLSPRAAVSPLHIVVSGLFPFFTFQGVAMGDRQSYYLLTTYNEESGTLISHFNFFRCADLDAITLSLLDGNNQIVRSYNLGLLLRESGISIENMQELEIPLEIVINRFAITITVKDWELEELGVEL